MKIITYESQDGRISGDFRIGLTRLLSGATPPMAVSVEEAGSALSELLQCWDGSSDLLELLLAHFNEDLSEVRLLISAGTEEKFRSYCLARAPHAQWGCCLYGCIAIEYATGESQLVTQLHESLHLFGVDDCYGANQTPKPSCADANCIMRYGVHSYTACSSALKQLKEHTSQ